MVTVDVGTNIILAVGDQFGSPEIPLAGANSISVQTNTTAGTNTGDLVHHIWVSLGSGWSKVATSGGEGAVGNILRVYSPSSGQSLKGANAVRVVFQCANAPVTFDASVNTFQE